jgi:hypothetical protein
MREAEVILLVRWGLRTFQLGCEWHEWMCLRREHLNHSLSTAVHRAEASSCGGPRPGADVDRMSAVPTQMWEGGVSAVPTQTRQADESARSGAR